VKTTSRSRKKSRARRIVAGLKRAYPEARCALRHEKPLQLLISTILSAQCTDVRVNIVTKDLFKRYRTVGDFARARQGQLQKEIHSTGFFRNKAKSIIGTAKMIEAEYGGEVPATMEELVRLPGVARKTANVVLGTWFGKNEGVVVDTHVHRIAGRLGLSRQKDPNKTEQDLMELIPREEWTDFSHRMIQHGRQICDARKPRCAQCSLKRLCPSAKKFLKAK